MLTDSGGGLLTRRVKRVFVIGPGFGLRKNKQQGDALRNAGFSLTFCHAPAPDELHFDVRSALTMVEAALRACEPHAVVCASRGGIYLIALWQRLRVGALWGCGWNGASVMVNAHDLCTELPRGVPIVIAHGAGDDTFPWSRVKLEELIKTGGSTSALLYFTANNGGRRADGHNMASLLKNDCLPHLIDAVIDVTPLQRANPEFNLARSWRSFVSAERQHAEDLLGFKPGQLRRFWECRDGQSAQKLFNVDPLSPEFASVRAIFLATPTVVTHFANATSWPQGISVRSIKRVENDGQEAMALAKLRNVERMLAVSNVPFTAGVHSRWLFHGSAALDGIVSNEVHGFTANASKGDGTKAADWGKGIYFARDAAYSDRPPYTKPEPDGTKRMLLSLVVIGISCLGSKTTQLCTQYRSAVSGHTQTYDSLVDDLSNPEIFVVPDAAHGSPAYIIQYK